VTKKRGDDGIDDSHIVEAQDLVQCGRLRNRIRDQTQHAHLLLKTLASLEQRGATPARSKTIKTWYERVTNAHAVDSRTTLKSIQKHLSDLHKLGFLQRTNRNRGESGGRYDEYDLDLAPEIVLDSSDEIETERDRWYPAVKTDETDSLALLVSEWELGETPALVPRSV